MIDKPENMSQIWAENGDVVDPGAAVIDAGWPTLDPATGDPAPPPHTYMNFIQNKMTKFLAHVNEYGIAVWDATTTYTTESWARSPVDNKVYVSTIDNNIGTEPSANPAQWEKFDISANVGDTIESYETIEIMEDRGYLAMKGQAVSRTTYAELFSLIGTTFGPGDGSTTFNLPGDIVIDDDEFVVFRASFPENTDRIRINADGEMFVFSRDSVFSETDTIFYQYANPSAENHDHEVSLGGYGGSFARELVPTFLSDGSFFLALKDDDIGKLLFEYKNNEMSIIELGENYACSESMFLFSVDENREILSYASHSIFSPSIIAQRLYVYDIPNDALQETTVPSEEFTHCPSFPAGGLVIFGDVATLNGVSFSFFGNKDHSPAIQNYRFDGNDQNNRTFSSCNTISDLEGFTANSESAAYFQSDIYKTATGEDSPAPGIVFRASADGVMAKVSETPYGARMAGIYNGDIYIYVYDGALTLYRKENRAKWIKAL